MAKKCICQICVCGRHRCPHRPFATKQQGPCNFSEYSQEYKKKHAPRPGNFKPAFQPVVDSGPISDKTTQRVDFIKHTTGRPNFRQPDMYQKPAGDIDTMTSYKRDYIPKDAPVSKPIRHDDARRVQGKFEGDPTYKTDYRKWQLPEKKLHHDPNVYQAPDARFDGDPTYKRDYIKHPYSMRQSLRPDEGGAGNNEPFDGRTGYRDEYIKHPMEARKAKEREPYKGPTAPLDDLTTHKLDFGPKNGKRSDSFKPDGNAFRSSEPLSDNTTNRNDYKKWALNRPAAYKPDEWVKPAGDMDLRTTTQIQFDKKPLNPTKAIKPQERRPVTANFDDNTTHKEDYRKWPLGDRTKPAMQSEYQPPEAPFEGISTVKSHFTPKPLNVPRSFKPDSSNYQSGPFDGNTMYRTDYVPKDSEPCPAALLDTTKSKYSYDNQNDVGHKFYRPMFETVSTIPPPNQATRISNVAFA